MNVLLSDSLGDEIFLAKLRDIGDSQLWHMNNTLQHIIADKKKETYQVEELVDYSKILECVNVLLEYCGQPKMMPIASEVKLGYDIQGNKFDNAYHEKVIVVKPGKKKK